jgi:hypothetical protein
VNDQTTSPEPTASWWEDYLEIFFAPSQVFARREKSGFLLPLVILTVLSGVLIVGLKGSFAPAFEADITRQMELVQQNNPQITAEQLEQGRAMQGTLGTIMFVAMMPILALIIGFTLWLFGKFVGATETLSQAMLIAAFASFPRIVYLLAGGIQGLVMPEESLNGMSRLSLGPARFLDPDSASALSVVLASRFDLTLIWITILLAIGLKVISKIPMSKAMVAAGLVWLVGALPGLLGAMRAGG